MMGRVARRAREATGEYYRCAGRFEVDRRELRDVVRRCSCPVAAGLFYRGIEDRLNGRVLMEGHAGAR